MLILNKPVVLFIKAANKVLDFIFFILGIFGLRPEPNTKDWYYQGVRFTDDMHKGNVEQIPDFEIGDSDIFQITYPRSGTHFTTEIIDCILNGGDTSKLRKVHQLSRSFFIDFGHPYKAVPLLRLLQTATGDVQRASRDLSGYYKSVKGPRFLRSHVPVQFAPKALLEGKGKLIYIARNPKDTLVSQWKLVSSLENSFNVESWNSCYESLLDGSAFYGSWFSHVIGYWNYRNKKNVLFLKYEDMRADIHGTIRELAKFLERGPLSDEIVEKIANHCSFKNMKANEMTYEDMLMPSFAKLKGNDGLFIRKGVVGGWKNELTEEESKRIKEEYEKKVAKHGLTFDFE